MNIGIDIDGVLTNDDEYLLDFTSKYCYENNLSGFLDANLYEYSKYDWDEDTINDYRKKYFVNYCKNVPARRFASEVIKKLRKDGHKIFIITGRHKTAREINAESMNFDKRQNKTRIEKASVYSKSRGRRQNGRKNIPKSLHGEN